MLRRRSKHGPIGLDIGTSGTTTEQFTDEEGDPVLVAAVGTAPLLVSEQASVKPVEPRNDALGGFDDECT